MMNEFSAFQTPLLAPYYFYYLFPESLDIFFNSNPFGTLLLKVIMFFGNVLIYSIPFYLIVTIINSIKNKENQES